MKSIYEEAKETLYILKSIESVDEDGTPNGDSLSDCFEFDVIEKALEQAQKQEKLLNQIKEIIDRPEDSWIASMLESSNKFYEIEELIKELESETKDH